MLQRPNPLLKPRHALRPALLTQLREPEELFRASTQRLGDLALGVNLDGLEEIRLRLLRLA